MDNSKKALAIAIVSVILAGTASFVMKTKTKQDSTSTNISATAIKKHTITPNQARDFLNNLDMPTRDYEDTGEEGAYGKYEARSDYYMLETRDPNRYINNLTYYVSGDSKVAKAVSLVLNVNDMSFKSKAVDELIKYSDGLMLKTTGENLTPQIKKAMQANTAGEWIINDYKIKLQKETALSEKIVDGMEPTSDPGAFSLTFYIEL